MTADELAAHIEIPQLLYRYCRGVDRGSAELIKSVYHPGAQDEHGGFSGAGTDFAEMIVERMDVLTLPSQHHITNILIQLDGDKAAVESYYLALHAGLEGVIPVGGRYLDRFERRNGEWRIAHRRVVIDWSHEPMITPAWSRQAEFPAGRRRAEDPSFADFAHAVER